MSSQPNAILEGPRTTHEAIETAQPAIGTGTRLVTASRSGTPKRRVCHVSLGLCTGGMERLLVEFARCYDRQRYELEFVALHNVGQPAEDIRAAGCQVHLLPDRRG